MKRLFIFLCLCLGLSITKLSAITQEETDRLSEALGHFLVKNLSNPSFSFNLDKIIQGMRDAKEGKPSPMKEEEYEGILATLQGELFEEVATTNLTKANEFLKKNETVEGVHQISEKLQYKVLHAGSGEVVTPTSYPLIHYKGTLLDGSVFADSHERGMPVTLPLQQAILGFSQGLEGMKEGEKRVLYIHPELAYGVSGHLPPNSLLIFEVEIVKVQNEEPIEEVCGSDSVSS